MMISINKSILSVDELLSNAFTLTFAHNFTHPSLSLRVTRA